MNKTFKVARSLTRGTVVTSEKASSYQGKAVKTVIAAAVATLVAGSAMAAATTFTEVTLTEGTDITFTGDKSAANGTVNGKVETTQANDTFEAGDTLATSAKVIFQKGELSVIGVADKTVGSIDGSGTITIDATKTAGSTLKVTSNVDSTKAQTFKDFNINLGVVNTASQAGQNATLDFGDANNGQVFASGVLKTTVVETVGSGTAHGVATLQSSGSLTFGTATQETTSSTHGNGAIKVQGTSYNFDVQADTKVAGTTVNLVNSTVSVAEGSKLTVSASTGNVAVYDEVAFQNKGLVSLEAKQDLTFDADYDASAGKLALSGANVTVTGTIKGGELQLGAFEDKDTATVALVGGTTNTIGESGSVSVNTLSFNKASQKPLTVDGKLTADATNVSVSDAELSVGVSGTASLGAVTVKDIETTAANLKLTNQNAVKAVTAESLTINAAQKKADGVVKNDTEAGTATLIGDFEIGTLTNNAGGMITLGDTNASTGASLSIVKAGASQNAGTISGSNTSEVIVAKDVAFSNTGTIDLGQDGSLEVTGTLTNVYTPAVLKDDKKTVKTPAVAGTINANTLTIKNGGVVDTEFVIADSGDANTQIATKDTYTVKTTTIEEGGKFVTSLNGQVDTSKDPKDIVELKQNFVLAGGEIVERTSNTAVSDLKLAAGKTLTAEADYTFGKIIADGTGSNFNIDGGAVTVADLKTAGTVISNGGSLQAATLKAGEGNITVEDGTLTASLANLNLKVKSSDKSLEADGTSSTNLNDVKDKAIKIGQAGVLVISDFQTSESSIALTKTGVATLLGASGKVDSANFAGVIDLGNVNLEENGFDKNTGLYKYSSMLNGVTTKALKEASVDTTAADATNNKITHSESFGNIYTGEVVAGPTTQPQTLTIENAVVTLNKATQNGSLVWYNEKADNTSTAAKTEKVANVQLGGDSGASLVVTTTGAVGDVKAVAGKTGNLELTETGVLTANDVDVSAVEVAASGSLTAKNVTTKSLDLAGTLTVAEALKIENTGADYIGIGNKIDEDFEAISGEISTKTMSAAGDLLVTGKVSVADMLNTGSTAKVYVGDDKNAGYLSVGKLVSGSTVFADPAWVDGKSEAKSQVIVGAGETDTSVVAGRNSIAYLGITAEADVNAADQTIMNSGYTLGETSTAEADGVRSEETKTVNSILYVAGADKTYLGFAAATDLTAESYEALPNSSQLKQELRNGVYVGKDSMLVMDAAKVDTTGAIAVFDKDVTLEEDSILFIDNLKNGDKIKLSQGAVHDHDAIVAFTGDLVMGYDFVANGDSATHEGTLAVTMQSGLPGYGFTGAGADLAYAYFAEGVNATDNSNAFLNKLLTSSTTFGDIYQAGKEDVNYTGLAKILNEGAAIGATTGVQTMTMDAVNQMADTVGARTSILAQRGQGVNVWADVNGGKFEAKTLFDGAGYSSDIYSGVLGLDYQFSCNAVLGAALTIGTADTDSKNTAFASSTDSDLVGFSVYASKTFADIWNVSADIGYLQASNEVSTSGYGVAYKFDQDTDAFTVGVRGEVLTKAGAVNVVPHVGLRFTQLSTDSANALYRTDVDDMNVFQMPVGVALSADFETSGWTIAPKFDLSVVPTFGDKDAELKLGLAGVAATSADSVRVIDSNPVQAQLGINATNGAWGFGLNYKLGVGSEDRMNNSFNANVRYAF